MTEAAVATSNGPLSSALCSRRQCQRILGPSKGNLCEQCTAEIRFPDSTYTKGNQRRSDGIDEVRLTRSMKGSLPLPLPKMREDFQLDPSSQLISAAPTTAKTHITLPKRPSFAIPYQTATTTLSRGPQPVLATGPNVSIAHFNSRGEIVGFDRPRSSPNEVQRTSELDTSGFSLAPASSLYDDEDIDSLEFAYPPSPEIKSSFESLHILMTHNNPEIRHPMVLPSISRSSKRQKSSQPQFSVLPGPSHHQTSKPVRPIIDEVKSTPFRSLKLCSTADCTGIISSDSFATRCLNCVRNDWMFKRSKSSVSGKRVHVNGKSSDTPRADSQTRPASKRRKKMKVVTWADEIAGNMKEVVETTDSTMLASESITYDENDTLTEAAKAMDRSIEPEENLSIILESTSPSVINDATFVTTQSQPLPDQNQNNVLDASERKLPLKIRLVVSPISNGTVTIPSPTQRSGSPCGPCPSSSAVSEQQGALGWDSDLTELSDSAEDSEFSAESESNTGSTASGFKIRIPPRPGGIYARKCASPRCNQVLAINYRWKSCVMCRAQSRDYQRKRQNLQGRHIRLDQELLEAQNMGTPLAGELHKQDTHMEEDPVMLVPGARLCSIRNCTYIIPPVDQYHWKMCALCRLRRREKKKQDRLGEGLKGSAAQVSAALFQKAIKCLPLRGGLRSPGICQSVDCGMLVLDSKSSQCKQCLARHVWLTNRSGGGLSVQTPAQRLRYVQKPRRTSLYPQFKCFSTFLLEFKNRLSGFVKAQSVFYLYRRIHNNAKALFALDGEFSIVAADLDIVNRKDEIDGQAMGYKREIEYIGRIKFNSKRLISILEGGGIAIRFVCMYSVPILQATVRDNKMAITTISKDMQCELEIANVPDDSHRFIPGQRTIIRFRLLG